MSRLRFRLAGRTHLKHSHMCRDWAWERLFSCLVWGRRVNTCKWCDSAWLKNPQAPTPTQTPRQGGGRVRWSGERLFSSSGMEMCEGWRHILSGELFGRECLFFSCAGGWHEETVKGENINRCKLSPVAQTHKVKTKIWRVFCRLEWMFLC